MQHIIEAIEKLRAETDQNIRTDLKCEFLELCSLVSKALLSIDKRVNHSYRTMRLLDYLNAVNREDYP